MSETMNYFVEANEQNNKMYCLVKRLGWKIAFKILVRELSF